MATAHFMTIYLIGSYFQVTS